MPRLRWSAHLILAVVVVAAVGWSSPGAAQTHPGGLTTAEKASLQQLAWAAYGQKASDVGDIHNIYVPLGNIMNQKTLVTTRAKIAQVLRLTIQAQKELGWALVDLAGTPDPAHPTEPRSYFVARALARIDKVQTQTLPSLQAAADAAAIVGATLPGTSFTMDRIKNVHAKGAIAKLKLVDRTLLYADPYPPGRSPAGRITIIGPHGDYLLSQRWASSALDRLTRMFNAVLAGYDTTEPLLPGYWNTYQQEKFSSLLMQKNGVTIASYMGLTGFTGYSTNPFFRVLGLIEDLSHGGGGPVTAANNCLTNGRDSCHGASYDFNNMMLFGKADERNRPGRPIFAAQQSAVESEITEAWQAMQTGQEWMALTFPECDQVVQPAGCGGTGN
jgi:hypothetical protein